ncbi:MAG: aldolase catalytic domain-containing protein [Clostridia bacterium]
MSSKKNDIALSNENKLETLEKVGTMLTFRPDIKVVDCTIRDGGLVNRSMFEDDFVKAVYLGLEASGVDYMEVGYKTSKKILSTAEYGTWKFCDEEDIRRIVGDNDAKIKISVMADAERTDYHEDILPKSQSVIDLVRVATYVNQIPTALDMIKDAHDKGYETTINLMAASTVGENELIEAITILAESEVDIIYVVDSFGSLYTENIRALMYKYLAITKPHHKQIGIHAHNNQQLAFANTIEALTLGANYLDSSIYGLGRGAGNCNTELLLGFLKNPKYHVRPLLQCITENFLPFMKNHSWGFDIPYMLTGQLNRHPQPAIKAMKNPDNIDFTEFYDSLIEDVD